MSYHRIGCLQHIICVNDLFVVLMFFSVVTYFNICAHCLFIVFRTNEKAHLLKNVKNVFNFKSRLHSTTEVEMNRK